MNRAILNFFRRWGVVIVLIIWVLGSILVPSVISWYSKSPLEWEWFRALGFYAAGFVLAPIGLWLAMRRTLAIQEQAEADTRRTETDAKRQFSEAFSRAVELLGNDNTAVRQGAIHALAGLARENPEQQWTIFNIITSYIRERSPNPLAADVPKELPVDIETAVMEIVNRSPEPEKEKPRDYYDLSNTYLRGMAIYKENTDLKGFLFNETDFSDSLFSTVSFAGSFFMKANLSGSWFDGADLSKTQLDEANLSNANFVSINLSMANLSGAKLHGVDLSNAENLTQEQIDQAEGDEKTILPDGITRPDQWIKNPPSDD